LAAVVSCPAICLLTWPVPAVWFLRVLFSLRSCFVPVRLGHRLLMLGCPFLGLLTPPLDWRTSHLLACPVHVLWLLRGPVSLRSCFLPVRLGHRLLMLGCPFLGLLTLLLDWRALLLRRGVGRC
jgi:hypothetical protein